MRSLTVLITENVDEGAIEIRLSVNADKLAPVLASVAALVKTLDKPAKTAKADDKSPKADDVPPFAMRRYWLGCFSPDKKIPAIKELREITGCGLAEGKDAIEGKRTFELDDLQVEKIRKGNLLSLSLA